MHALIRVQNLSSAEVGRADIHNNRKHEELGFAKPMNVKDSNKWLEANLKNDYQIQANEYLEAVNERYEKLGIKPRKGAVMALEYVIAVSPDAFEKILKEKDYVMSSVFSRLSEFIYKKHGVENVISSAIHYDENTPHMHLIVTPVVEKKTKWEIKKEEKTGVDLDPKPRLCAKDFTGGKRKLSKLQDDFYHHANEFMGRRFGIPLTKHIKADKQERVYQQKTNHLIGELSESIRELRSEMDGLRKTKQEVKAYLLKIEEKEREVDKVLKERELLKEKEVPSKKQIKDIKWNQTQLPEGEKPLKFKEPKTPKKGKGFSM
jgi:hypothetical protein